MPEAATWGASLVAVGVVSLCSASGAVLLFLRKTVLDRGLLVLVSFAAGALLGDAFLHILPELSESARGFDVNASLAILAGVIAFFMLEKVLHWHHSHIPHEDVIHPVAVTNLVGDGLHNFIDGAIIGGAFLASTELGIATTIAVALHEIPQELGDFGILVHSGMKPRRALGMNLVSAIASIIGAVAALLLADFAEIERLLLPFTAGAFVYIASTDLIPELHKEPEVRKSFVQVVALVAGVAVMYALLGLE
ncbi:MAG: ZIP family metal transporter [Actinomycetota bacterium]